jgi:hypothetical protein
VHVYAYLIWSSFIKSGSFATVDVAVEAINLEESVDKTTSGDAGRNTVSNKEANKAVGG